MGAIIEHLSNKINMFYANMKICGKLFDFELGHNNLTMDGINI